MYKCFTFALFAVLNCPLPFFFLPLAPWATGGLLGVVHFVWCIELFRIVFLAVLVCV